jgi:hypothetical protein
MRVRRSKYTKRKGYSKYTKHYTRKYGKRIQQRRQTRKKIGGLRRPFNFVLPVNDPRFNNIEIQGQGWAYVTKLGSVTSRTDSPEQIIIYQKKDSNGNVTGNYFIARCTFAYCDNGLNMESKILETADFTADYLYDKNNQRKVSLQFMTTLPQQDRYRISFTDEDNVKCSIHNTYYPLKNDNSFPAFYVKKFTGIQPLQEIPDTNHSSLASIAPEDTGQQAAVNISPELGEESGNNEDVTNQYAPPTSEKDRQLQELIDSINFKTPTIEDIRKMLKVTNDITCPFLCNPDECDETMLEKLRQKYMEKIEDKEISRVDDAIEIFYNTLDENLLLILENFYVQSQILTKEELKKLFSQCDQILSYSLTDARSTHKNLHGIMNMLYKKIRNSIINSDDYLEQNFENMKKLLDLLNSMTPENMQILLELLNSMTRANMQQLLQLLNSMSPENITSLLEGYNNLNTSPDSMAQLLELYSFIEKIDDDKFLIHRYPKGKTPFTQRLLINRKHKYATCESVLELNREVHYFGGTSFIKDKEFEKVVQECTSHTPPRLITGGGRRRKTLKKKRLRNSK